MLFKIFSCSTRPLVSPNSFEIDFNKQNWRNINLSANDLSLPLLIPTCLVCENETPFIFFVSALDKQSVYETYSYPLWELRRWQYEW